MQQEADKQMQAKRRASKKKFDELWLVKNCAAIGDSLHTKIKEGASTVGYLGRFCGFMPPLCKHNMGLACCNGFATCSNNNNTIKDVWEKAVSWDTNNCGKCSLKCPHKPHSKRRCKNDNCISICTIQEWRDCDGKNTNDPKNQHKP